MANPQTEHGFVMIALDLFAALMVADLPNRCMIVLAEHLIEAYGPGKKRSVRLDPATIEDHANLHRNNARRAIKELAEANILVPLKDGTYKFNKDYEAWTPGGESFISRLGGGTKRFAGWAKDRGGKPIKKSKKIAIQRDSGPAPNGATNEAEIPINTSKKDAIQRDSETIQRDWGQTDCLNPTGLRSSGQTPSNGIGSVAYSSDAKSNIESSSVLAGARASEEFRDFRTDRSASAVSTDRLIPGLAEAVATARGRYGEQIADMVLGHGADIYRTLRGRFDCYLAALDHAKRCKDPIGDLHAFCLTVAKRYLRDGMPLAPVTLEPAARSAPPIEYHVAPPGSRHRKNASD